MSRQLRVDYAGALYHVTSRGNERKDIFRSNEDRRLFLELLGETARRFGWILTAWVLMSNHFHLVVETPIAETLSPGMQWLNQMYAQCFNKKRKRCGHLFQGRFKSFLLEKESYLREVLRYVVLNPVRAKMVERPEDYLWSSYRATAGLEAAPEWLALGAIAPWFGADESWQANYRAFVAEKIGSTERLWDLVRNQIYLGSESWLKKVVRKAVDRMLHTDATPRTQRVVGRPNMHTVIGAVAKIFGMEQRAIRHGRGGLARQIAAWLGWYEGLNGLRSIAAALRINSSGRASDLVSQCEELTRTSPDARELIDRTLSVLAA